MKISVVDLKKLIKEAVMQHQPRQNMRVTQVLTAKDMDFHSNPWYLRALNSYIQLYMDKDQRRMHGYGLQPLSRHDIMYDLMAKKTKFVEVETALGKRFLIAIAGHGGQDLYNDVNDVWVSSSRSDTAAKLRDAAYNHVYGI